MTYGCSCSRGVLWFSVARVCIDALSDQLLATTLYYRKVRGATPPHVDEMPHTPTKLLIVLIDSKLGDCLGYCVCRCILNQSLQCFWCHLHHCWLGRVTWTWRRQSS
ncbi:hypothetical protein Pfo_005230 [Paulownia fortunei]|nr:hypothetical protein Pfo_005230 [Paulownia fortunei]